MLPGVGVFGTSLTARVIIPLLKDEGFAVKALWGRTQEEAEELAKEMSVPFYTSRIDEVLLHQDVDLVCINLPPPLTRQIAVKTLDVILQFSRTRAPWGQVPGWNLSCLSCLEIPTRKAGTRPRLDCQPHTGHTPPLLAPVLDGSGCQATRLSALSRLLSRYRRQACNSHCRVQLGDTPGGWNLNSAATS